ncbi:MAG: SUMF1/EgtB/PvdO family nonheme iron enzyme [Anaerolineae bacterium]
MPCSSPTRTATPTWWWNYSDNARIVRQSNLKPRTPENLEADHPRSAISWYDAVAFCRWLSEKCGLQITCRPSSDGSAPPSATAGRRIPGVTITA